METSEDLQATGVEHVRKLLDEGKAGIKRMLLRVTKREDERGHSIEAKPVHIKPQSQTPSRGVKIFYFLKKVDVT